MHDASRIERRYRRAYHTAGILAFRTGVKDVARGFVLSHRGLPGEGFPYSLGPYREVISRGGISHFGMPFVPSEMRGCYRVNISSIQYTAGSNALPTRPHVPELQRRSVLEAVWMTKLTEMRGRRVDTPHRLRRREFEVG